MYTFHNGVSEGITLKIVRDQQYKQAEKQNLALLCPFTVSSDVSLYVWHAVENVHVLRVKRSTLESLLARSVPRNVRVGEIYLKCCASNVQHSHRRLTNRWKLEDLQDS